MLVHLRSRWSRFLIDGWKCEKLFFGLFLSVFWRLFGLNAFSTLFHDITEEIIINFFGTSLDYGEIVDIYIPRGEDDGDKFGGVVYKRF